MNRSERMYSVLEALRRAPGSAATAAQLAGRLEVSARTIKRDITALQEAGSPIWAQTGPGGGYVLAESATMPPVNFTASQAVAVAVALEVLPTGSPFSADARAALGKLLDAQNPSQRSRARGLASKVWVMAAVDGPHARASTLSVVERSLDEQVAVSIRYLSNKAVVTRRVVEPIILAWGNGTWFLVAHCQLRDDVRWFKLAHIERAELTGVPYTPRPVSDIGTPPRQARAIEL